MLSIKIEAIWINRKKRTRFNVILVELQNKQTLFAFLSLSRSTKQAHGEAKIC